MSDTLALRGGAIMALIIFLLLIGLPIAEIMLFVKASGVIGWWSVIGLTILTAVLGTALIRVQGFQALHQLRASTTDGKVPVEPVVDGVFLLIAAPLMMTPGFITDAIGFLLLVPPVRHEIARYALRRFKRAAEEGRVMVMWRS